MPLLARASDFVKYVGVVRDLEPVCGAESYLAFPRFFIGGWCPFSGSSDGRALWEEDLKSGRQLWGPPGVQDMTERWVKLFCRGMKVDWKETLSGTDSIQLGPPGSVTRLHMENASAHTWHAQIQGQRAYVLFSPSDEPNLYAEAASDSFEGRCDFEAQRCSVVDVLRPARSLSKFRGCRAYVVVLKPGETLVVPQGWWMYSVTLEANVTLMRKFWNQFNKEGLCEELEAMYRENFEHCEGVKEGRERLRAHIERLRYQQQQGYSSDED